MYFYLLGPIFNAQTAFPSKDFLTNSWMAFFLDSLCISIINQLYMKTNIARGQLLARFLAKIVIN